MPAPEIIEITGGIQVTLFKGNAEGRQVEENSSAIKYDEGLVDSQKNIVKLIADNPKISKKEMAKSIGISVTAIDKNISTLRKKGVINRVGGDKGGSWQIIFTKEQKQ